MTRKDYVQVAESWGRSLAACPNTVTVHATIWASVLDQADMFGRLNPRFDRTCFLDAVRVSEEAHKAMKGLVS